MKRYKKDTCNNENQEQQIFTSDYNKLENND